jgi:hypothetical protein
MVYDFATCDPGLNTAIAYWGYNKRVPLKTEVFHCSTKVKTHEQKLADLQLGLIAHYYKCKKFYIEGVSVYSGSLKSMASATRGDLSLLSYIVGVYLSIFMYLKIDCEILSSQWKGQLDYDTLRLWVKRINGHEYKTEHEVSAVGMGLYVNKLL